MAFRVAVGCQPVGSDVPAGWGSGVWFCGRWILRSMRFLWVLQAVGDVGGVRYFLDFAVVFVFFL